MPLTKLLLKPAGEGKVGLARLKARAGSFPGRTNPPRRKHQFQLGSISGSRTSLSSNGPRERQVNCSLQSVRKVTSLRRTPRWAESTAMAFQVKQKVGRKF